MTRAVSLKLAAADQVRVQFSCEASKLSRLFYRPIPIGLDLLEPKIKADMTSICGNMYLYQATKFTSLLKSVTHSAAPLGPLFRSYHI